MSGLESNYDTFIARLVLVVAGVACLVIGVAIVVVVVQDRRAQRERARRQRLQWPKPVVERDWFADNYEGHRPTAVMWGASGRWIPSCIDGCITPNTDGVLAHLERADAVAQAAHIIAGRIHGPSDTEAAS